MVDRWVNAVLEAMRVPGMPRAFVLGSFERRVTIYSQQVRALNLVEALLRAHEIKPDTKIAVIGAGSAGLTFAAGAAFYDARVTVLERESELLPLFRHATNRWLHPRVYDWPLPGWNQASAGLPVLDWTAGTVGQVRAEQLRGWETSVNNSGDRLCVIPGASRIALLQEEHDPGITVSWNVKSVDSKTGPDTFDLVVLATGFGLEKGEVPDFRGYWEPDNIDLIGDFRDGIDLPKTWMVSGCGDGALTDLLRLCIKDFRHDQMVDEFATNPAITQVMKQIEAIERNDQAQGLHGARTLFEQYQRLRFDPVIDILKNTRARTDTKVTLNTAGAYFLQGNSSPLNRFLVAQLHHARRFEFLSGKVKGPVTPDGDRLRVTFEDGGQETFDRVLLRHGPRPASLESFPTVWKACEVMRKRWKEAPTLLDQTRERYWEEGAFGAEERFETSTGPAITASPSSLTATEALTRPPATATPTTLPTRRTPKLFGREALLQKATTVLEQRTILLVYGLRGNGKSSLIDALAQAAPLAGREQVRFVATSDTTAIDLFRQFATFLGDTAELPQPPTGDVNAIKLEILRRYPTPRPAWVWIDRAHLLLNDIGFRSPDVLRLLLGLCGALGARCPMVLELRERPPGGLLGSSASECEVPGLDKASLAACLLDGAPEGQEARWRYDGPQLKRIYAWLGGGHGDQAHPHAIQLLIEVARGHGETPIDVMKRHLEDFEQKIEDVLLGELINKVLNESERRLIQALALYRSAIPHDHADALERHLGIPGSWDGVYRRCLLASNSDQSLYYLHSFIAGWLRTRLGYSGHGEDVEADFLDTTNLAATKTAQVLHYAIAKCWLDQLGGSRRMTSQNVRRALEALHHLVAAGQSNRVQDIAVELFSGNQEWARQRIWQLYEFLFKSNAPNPEIRRVLEYAAALNPNNHKVQRFLGECWAKEEGRGSAKALRCFEEACKLRGDFPQYCANLGRTLLAQGKPGASSFLARLELLEREYPQAIDGHVRAIQADCLKLVGRAEQAAVVRMDEIRAGSRDAAFYADEAKARLEAGDAAGALEILDLAAKNGGGNEFTAAIRTSVLQRSGRGGEAAVLRMEKIRAGSRHATFYNDEAKARLEAGDAAGALEILDLAAKNGCENEFTAAIRTSVLQRSGA